MNSPRPPTLLLIACCVCLLGAASVANASPFFFSTGNVDGRMASASRPDSPSAFEIETGDDFVITDGKTTINTATFTGLLVGPTLSIANLVVEIYRVFPNDSDVTRTSGSPTFSTPAVPTRVNSPSDDALDSRDLGSGLTVTTNDLGPFSALNSLQPGGIPKPAHTTGGDGPLTGEEVLFNVTFTTPFVLDPDHYFFVPQVQLTDGTFYWLSSARPIVPPGTPFPAGFTDLQAWARDAALDPDWLRIGTDIVGSDPVPPAPTFNMAFSLDGTVPEPATLTLLGLGLATTARRFARKRNGA